MIDSKLHICYLLKNYNKDNSYYFPLFGQKYIVLLNFIIRWGFNISKKLFFKLLIFLIKKDRNFLVIAFF